jgi:hypothetical protein
MRLAFTFDCTQEVSETWVVEVSDYVNLTDFLEAVRNDSDVLFCGTHPDILSIPEMTDSETYDTLGMRLHTTNLVKEI